MALDLRRRAGAWLVKFLKIGRLHVSETLQSILEPKWDAKSYADAYSQTPWAYAGIYAIASAAASVPLKVVRVLGDDKPEDEPNHPFVKLLNDPNPFMTRLDLIELLFIFLESSGNGYWLLDDGGPVGRPEADPLTLRQVKEIWPLPSAFVRAEPRVETLIGRYLYRPEASGKGERLSTAEVLHVRYANPLSMIYGQGSLVPINRDLAGDLFMSKFENFILKNLAVNAIFLKTEEGLEQIQRDEFKKALGQVYQGVRVGFLENGLDFTVPSFSPKDLPLMDIRKSQKERILAALGVPPIFVGSQEAKYDNAEQQKQVFWENTMLPKLRKVEAVLTKKLHQLGEDPDLQVIFDTSGVKALQANWAVQADTAVKWQGMGVPVNSLIRVFAPPGMEEVDGGDIGLVSAALIPITMASEPPEPIEPEGTPEAAPPPTGGKPAGGGKPVAPEEEEEEPEEKAAINARDKAPDDAHWKKFNVLTDPGFRRVRAELRRFFKTQRNEVLERVRQYVEKTALVPGQRDPRIELILINVDEEARALTRRTSPLIRAIYARLGKQAITDVGADIAFNIGSPAAVNFLNTHVFHFSFEVNRTTSERLRSILTEKFAGGATQQDITGSIREEFGFYERWRSARIARTESGIAGNAGIIDGMRQAGVKVKRWISSRDEKVRDTHRDADGQQVDINDPFDVGGALLDRPGDPDGPAEEIINCRCAVRAALGGPGVGED